MAILFAIVLIVIINFVFKNSRFGYRVRACGGNRTRAARELGMDRTTLWRKLQKYIQK